MTLEQINPFIRRAFLLNTRPENKTVINADSRLFYVLEGSGEIVFKDRSFIFEKDALGLWKSGTSYCWKFSKNNNCKLAIINFDYTRDFSMRSEMLPLILQKKSYNNILDTGDFSDIQSLNEPIFLKNAHILKDEILSIIEEYEEKKLHYTELASGMLKQLIIKAVRYNSSSVLPQTKIETVLDYIRSNYEKEITNVTLGKLVNYHPHYINALMKSYSGTTLHAYLLEFRLNQALKLVVNGSKSIEEIALTVGFKNTTHFCNAFKKKYGMSPSSYRKSSKII